MSESFRKESRRDWSTSGGAAPTLEWLQFGAIQRIADATELMARRHQELVDERDRYKRWYDTEHSEARRLARSNNALRGQITKLKKALAAARENNDE